MVRVHMIAPLLASIGLVAQTEPALTIVNSRALTEQQKRAFTAVYRVPPLPGRFWYDSRSGLWGLWGREAAGFLLPGHDFGTLPREASAGHTGIFINGREINDVEAAFIVSLYGAAYRGRWWLLAYGYFGVEGSPAPMGNLGVALRRVSGAETHVSHDEMSVNTSSTCCNSVFTRGAGGSSIAAFPGC